MNARAFLPFIGCGAVGLLAGFAIGLWAERAPTLRSPVVSGAGAVAAEASANVFQPGSGFTPAGKGPKIEEERVGRILSVLQQPIALRQGHELFEVLRDFSGTEIAAMMIRTKTVREPTAGELREALVERWFEVDPAGAQAWARSSPEVTTTILELWVKADPDGALQAALESRSWWKDTLFISALHARHADDVAGKLATIATLPALQRDQVLPALLEQWAHTDPQSAYAYAEQLPSASHREDARFAVLSKWAESDPARALARLDEMLPGLKAGVLGNRRVVSLVEKIAGKNPKAALEWLARAPEELRAAPAIATAAEWAQQEPLAALDWCQINGVDIAQVRRIAVGAWRPSVLGEAVARSPFETVSWVESLPAGTDRDRLLERTLLNGLSGEARSQFSAEGGALAWRVFQQLSPEAQIATAGEFGKRHAEQGAITDLGEWARSFPAGDTRANAVAGAMLATYRRDASQANRMLAQAPTSADRDAALRGLVEGLSSGAPGEAVNRAASIQDPTVRRQTLEPVIDRWLSSDPAAGRAWLEAASSVPADWKREWLAADAKRQR